MRPLDLLVRLLAVCSVLVLARPILAGQGLLVGAQLRLTQDDYRTEATFTAALERALAPLDREPRALPKVVVLPECVGLPLVVTDAAPALFACASMDLASAALAAGLAVQDGGFRATAAQWLVRTGGNLDRATGNALLTHEGRRALELYLRVFAGLARRHGITLCAGSLLCPGFTLVDGRPRFDDGLDIYNTCVTFGPDGRVVNVTRKVFPTADESGVVTPAKVEQVRAFDTPLGRAGVLVCADGWFPECYRQLRAERVEIVLQPSMMFERSKWERPWGGYSGWPLAADVDRSDVGKLTEAQAWDRYALVGRIASCGARAGVNPFQVGRLWEHVTGGRTRAVVLGPHGYEARYARGDRDAELVVVRVPGTR